MSRLGFTSLSSLLLLLAAPAAAQLRPGDETVAVPDRFADVIGPRAEIVRTETGSVRMIYGMHVLGAGEPSERALAFVRRFAGDLDFPADVALELVSELDTHGFHVVRLQRVEHGVPVAGAGAVVRFLRDGAIDLVLVRPGAHHLASGTATMTEARARQILEARGRTVLATAPRLHSTEDGLVPVWAVVSTLGAPTTMLETVLDARDEHELFATPLAIDAMGTTFERNRTSDMNVTTDVELLDLTSTSSLTGTYFRALQCTPDAGGCTGTQTGPDAAGDYLFAPEVGSYTDPFAEVSAYHHGSRVAAYFRTTHGFTWTCGGGTRMDLLVNYVEAPMRPYDNAAFSPGFRGSCGVLLFGQGFTGDFAWDGDVVYHEFGHAVTDQVTDLGFFLDDTLGSYYDPLAVNEAASDYWAAVVQGNGSIAESFSGAGGIGAHGSLRVIDGDLTCPSALIGEGHEDGRLFSGMGWQIRSAIDPDLADAIFFATIASTDGGPSLSDIAVLYRATAMGMMASGDVSAADLAVIDAEIAERSLEGCRRIVPLDDLAEHHGYSGQEFVTGGVGRGIAPVHFSFEVPVDATALTISIARLTAAGNYRLHFRAGSPVRVGRTVTSSMTFDAAAAGSAVLDGFTTLPLPRCQTLYVAVEVLDLTSVGQSLFSIQAMLETSGDPTATCPELPDAGVPVPDAGPEPDAGTIVVGSGSGCGCAAHRTDAPTLSLVALAALALARRRKR